jgi:glycerol-3-phosphate acyltransferase PlsY
MTVNVVLSIGLIIISYLIGSVPTGIIVAKILGAPDPRTVGSGNIGATNVGRAAGKTAGIITLVGDILKGVLITLFAFYAFGSPVAVSLAGFSVFLGHLFPVFLKFKGGKGVATALGIFLSIAPLQAVVALAIFAAIVAIFRYVSLGSMISAASLPVLLSLSESTIEYVILSALIAIFIIFRHSDNIKRLIQGTENKVGGKGKTG